MPPPTRLCEFHTMNLNEFSNRLQSSGLLCSDVAIDQTPYDYETDHSLSILRSMRSDHIRRATNEPYRQMQSLHANTPVDEYEFFTSLDNNRVPRGPTATEKKKYIQFVSQYRASDLCSICHVELGAQKNTPQSRKARVVEIPCGHQFHFSCIDKWYEMEKTCPICRKELGAS